ncbi:major facilitator superfamily domain-containing protein [Lactifluus volemus]|nr:major facilitator superfamily domain-containing protein [Lactifluus volemus]
MRATTWLIFSKVTVSFIDMKRIFEILPSRSCGLQWRASPWFITLGITTDFLIYSIIIPVIPFHLQDLGYSEVSSLVGYLLVAYVSTPFIAWYSERQNSRKGTLLIGLLALACSQALFMESREYWIMAIARLLQGISASIVWTAGLALVCDTVPEEKIGRYLGLAMAGLPLGQLVGPPVGGALFDRFGIRGPCVFGIIVIAVDLMCRLLLIERREALVGGFDPVASYGTFDTETDFSSEAERQPLIASDSEETDYADSLLDRGADEATRMVQREPISFFQIIKGFFGSSRAVAALVNSFVYGILYSCQEPTLPIYLHKKWQLHSSEVGLVFIAAALPAMLSPPVAGWFADRVGTEWVTFACLLLAIPCWVAVVLPSIFDHRSCIE